MEARDKVYVDQAATSYPKPDSVYEAVDRFARDIRIGGGRGNYAENRQVARLVGEIRELLGELLNCDPDNVILNSGTTESMNLLLRGGLQPGDHVLLSPLEHNCVLRPLRYLADARGVEYTYLPASIKSGFDIAELEQALRPETRLCVLNHIANSFGTRQDIRAAGEILADRDVHFVLDAAQSLATAPVDVEELNADAVCFSGHKGPLGPTGTGGLYISDTMVEAVEPLLLGGTGRNGGTEKYSDSLPHKYEVGTQNSWGLAGLKAGLEHVSNQGVTAIEAHIDELTEAATERLDEVEAVELFQPEPEHHHGVVSFRLQDLPVADTGMLLDKLFDVKVRAGLHCSPEAHKLAGTYPDGTVRASFGLMNGPEDVRALHEAVADLAADSSN